ncbi:hypothetical protein G6F67_006942 [Rhizopus microsporus]|nr:hypothetical protein G6F67_006942 [Rhizopus microsporus]
MKFLEVNSLEVINTALSWETSECILTGRVEAYSCKSAGTDKKLFKTLEQRYNTLAPGSISPDDIQVVSPFGRLTESTPRKTFFYLLATLNAAFPDNDFENVRPDQFIKMPSVEMVMNSVNTTLFNLGNDVVVNQYRLWDVLDEIVQLNECDVYTYNPDADDDPMNDEDGYLTLNPALVYDYTLRCAIRACLEQNSKASLKEPKKDTSSNRYSVHLSGMSDVFENLADKIVGDEGGEKSNKLTNPVVVGFMRRLDDIKDGKDVSKSEYIDRRFISVVRHMRDEVKQYRFRPQGSINDLVVTFLKLKILLLVLREDAPSAASSEYIESLQRSILPKPKQQSTTEQRNSSSSGNSTTDTLDMVEDFPMNYLLDLKQCINAINMNQPFPGKREDFASQQAYDFWVAREKKYLNGLMTVMVMNPNLTLANKSEQDIGPTNLLTGRRSSDSRRSFVYDTSPTDDSPYTLFIYPPLPQMAACL